MLEPSILPKWYVVYWTPEHGGVFNYCIYRGQIETPDDLNHICALAKETDQLDNAPVVINWKAIS